MFGSNPLIVLAPRTGIEILRDIGLDPDGNPIDDRDPRFRRIARPRRSLVAWVAPWIGTIANHAAGNSARA